MQNYINAPPPRRPPGEAGPSAPSSPGRPALGKSARQADPRHPAPRTRPSFCAPHNAAFDCRRTIGGRNHRLEGRSAAPPRWASNQRCSQGHHSLSPAVWSQGPGAEMAPGTQPTSGPGRASNRSCRVTRALSILCRLQGSRVDELGFDKLWPPPFHSAGPGLSARADEDERHHGKCDVAVAEAASLTPSGKGWRLELQALRPPCCRPARARPRRTFRPAWAFAPSGSLTVSRRHSRSRV